MSAIGAVADWQLAASTFATGNDWEWVESYHSLTNCFSPMKQEQYDD